MGREDTDRFRALAEQRYATIADPGVFACWHVVVEAIGRRWLTPGTVDGLIGALETGGGAGVEEYGIDVVDHDEVEVALVGDRFTCSRRAMLAELRALAAAERGEDAPHDLGRAVEVLRALADLAGADRDTEAGGRARAEASARLAEWAADPAPDTVSRAAEGLTQEQRDRLVSGLRVFAEWAERPDAASGRRVDAVVEGLERVIGPLLEHGRAAERAAAEARIAAAVRDSVERRVREAGAG
ncbi:MULTISPECIES: hypothetical protein [Actinosynnema]|uniref:hypothetical protein n=1 Tax=Actinosynnema TaxID=40566 RepID=UPI0020A5B9D0|nr:hypothetical protein [Actinosynnema pretiosum]MCP2094341.1 hypothetical protein [Actinosynnema pretiosum]